MTTPPGPTVCQRCGDWPASPSQNGPRCRACECRDYAAANPVPLPYSTAALKDLASIGVPGALAKLESKAEQGMHAKLAAYSCAINALMSGPPCKFKKALASKLDRQIQKWCDRHPLNQ